MKQPAAPGDHSAPDESNTGSQPESAQQAIATAFADMPDLDMEAIEEAAEAANARARLLERPVTLMDVWQVRSFKYARQRGYDFPDGTGTQTRLAEIVVELGQTGIYQTGIGIVEREYKATASPLLRGRKGKVVQLNTRQVGGGQNRAAIPIFEAADEAGRLAIKAWKKNAVTQFEAWLKQHNIADTAKDADVFDGD